MLELAEAGDLGRYINHFKKRKFLMPEKTVWGLFREICAGLEYMHREKVVHRDIRPSNIFITVGGAVKLGNLSAAAAYVRVYPGVRSQ